MKILHVIDSMDPERGGPPQVVAHLAANQSIDHEVSLASYSNSVTCQKIVAVDELTCHEVNFSGLSEKLFGTASRHILRGVVKDVDIVHIHNVWEPIMMSAASLARQNQIPYVVTPHGMLDPWSMNQKWAKKRIALLAGRRKMLENAKFIHVLNDEEEQGIRKLGISNRCEVIANGVNLEQIDPYLCNAKFEAAYPDFAEKPFVLFLSRLHYKKGLDILGQVANAFCIQFPDWLILVAGPDGGAKSDFQNQISSLGLEKQVQLLGPIYGELKYSLLSACEFYCLPSRQEGFSVAILEAMAASKPVAITTHCHFDDVQAHQGGFVSSIDPDAIAQSFFKLASSTELRNSFGKNARKMIEENYTWAKISQSLLEKYRS